MVSRNNKSDLSGAEFEKQYREAMKRAKAKIEWLPKAAAARYEAKSKRVVLDLVNGVTLFVPVGLIQGLQTSDEKALGDLELKMDGTQIHWITLDVQFYVEDLLRGVFGTPKWMKSLNGHLADIGRKGGSSRSVSKSIAARENGKKGGRPVRKVA